MSMFSAPLSSTAFLGPAYSYFRQTTNDLALSTARLSSGNRLIRAGDDVAALALVNRLDPRIISLRQAQGNVAQGTSLLQIAYGGLTQIGDILDSMKSLATQSGSGSLTSTDRANLQAQFEEYAAEIDRIAGNTTFGNIRLLDGSFSGQNRPETTTTAATKASGSLAFTSIAGGNTVVLNGVTFTAGTEFAVGGTLADTIDNLVTALNNSTNAAISNATYTRSGNSLNISYDAGGELGNQYIINQASSTATFTTSGNTTNVANVFTLASGADNGLNIRSTKATGTIGDSVVNTQAQTAASVTLTVTGTISNGETLRIDNGNGGYVDFTFATVAATATDIQIGASTEETLENAIKTISQYSATDDYGVRQLELRRNGSQLIISNRNVGNPTDLSGANLDIAETMANGSLSAVSFNNGTNTGINTSGVTNADFVGTVSGFTATQTGADAVTASLIVGNSTYTATISDTTPASNTTVRFTSANGGYFDVQLAAGNGTTVGSQANADTYAARLDAAISNLTFYQDRNIESFTASGQLANASAKIQLDDFENVKIESIRVTAPVLSGGDATIEFSVNGKTFRSQSGIGGSIGQYEAIKFTNTEDGNEFITLTNGNTTIDLSDNSDAETFQTSLRNAFALDVGGSGVSFQVGADNSDAISVSIDNVSFDSLFGGESPSISTQEDAEDASALIDAARDSLSAAIAQVGASQSRFDIANDNLTVLLDGLNEARAQLADTDIASESTTFATLTLRSNVALATIAQANKLQSGLLKALEF